MKGKVAIVTGGASGIGRAAALALAKAGAKVVVSDVNIDGCHQTEQMIKDAGGTAVSIKADVSKDADVKALVQKTVDKFGRIDAAFNNAGIEGSLGIETATISEDEFDQTIATNLKGVWLCMKHEIPEMLKQGNGTIVNTSSVAGLVGIVGAPAYVASKHAVVGLTKTAALEYAKRGVRINAVCPGIIHTPMVARAAEAPGMRDLLQNAEPVGRWGEPEEIGDAVVWLCSDASSFLTGAAIPIDGGWVAQ